jgi:sugar/nucleoside kinase (ribokinase family)
MKTGLLTSLGRDAAGGLITDFLTANGVSTELIQRSDEHQTPVTTIFVLEDGNRRSITNQAHKYNFHPERYMDRVDARAVILGSLFRAPFNDPEVISSVLSEAKSRGMLVFADTKLPNFRQLTLDDISEMLPMIDFITPNLSEAEHYSGRSHVSDMADVFLEKGVRNVIIKLGGDGCYFKGKGLDSDRSDIVEFRLHAYNADTIDATGAGDNFIAGFVEQMAYLIHQRMFHRCLFRQTHCLVDAAWEINHFQIFAVGFTDVSTRTWLTLLLRHCCRP